MKNLKHAIKNRIHYLQACSAVPKKIRYPRTLHKNVITLLQSYVWEVRRSRNKQSVVHVSTMTTTTTATTTSGHIALATKYLTYLYKFLLKYFLHQ